jgi:hypothetical protein
MRGGAVALVLAAVLLAPVAAMVPLPLLLLGAGAVVLAAVGYAHPPAAAYLLIVATPLTAGLARSALIPLLRPHEALGLVLGTGVAVRALAQLRAGHRLSLRLRPLDLAILLMAGTGSLLPFLWMAARGLTPTQDDLLYASAIWKFYGLYVLIRVSVRTERQVSRCLHLSVAAGAVVAVVAILQSLRLAGVPHLVDTIYPTEGTGGLAVGRGSSTIGSPIAVGDVMAFNLAICLGWLLRLRHGRRLLVPAAALFTLGALASGQVSGAIALAVVVLALAVVTGYAKRLLLLLVPAGLAGAVILRPVLQARLAGFDPSTGLPQSWYVRLVNLRTFIWPQVFSGFNWLFGVRPAARVLADVPWGPYIYIESGYTWLLWTGGLPFLLAFGVFMWLAVRTTASVARARRDAVGVAAAAGWASLLAVLVLMSFDPHITIRGTADLLFTLLALATAAVPGPPVPGPPVPGPPVPGPPVPGPPVPGPPVPGPPVPGPPVPGPPVPSQPRPGSAAGM